MTCFVVACVDAATQISANLLQTLSLDQVVSVLQKSLSNIVLAVQNFVAPMLQHVVLHKYGDNSNFPNNFAGTLQ